MSYSQSPQTINENTQDYIQEKLFQSFFLIEKGANDYASE